MRSGGLSQLQRKILHLTRAKTKAYFHEIMAAVHGWRDKAAHQHSGQHFSPAQVGVARYNASHAALSRAVSRLESRGLVTVHKGALAQWTYVALTTDGMAVAATVKTDVNCDTLNH